MNYILGQCLASGDIVIAQVSLQSPVNVIRCECVCGVVHMSVNVHAYKDFVRMHIYACLCTEMYVCTCVCILV